MAHQALRRPAHRRVIVHHQHEIFPFDPGGHQAAVRERRRLARQKRTARLKVLGQNGVDGLLFGRDEPALVIIGALADAFVEELEHLAQATGLEAAHLHVLHEDIHLVAVQHARAAAHGRAHPRIAHDVQGQLAHGHRARRIERRGRVGGQKRPVARRRPAVGAHDAHGQPGLGDAAGVRCKRRRDVVGRVVLHARACALDWQFEKFVHRVPYRRDRASTHRSASIHPLWMKPFARSPPASQCFLMHLHVRVCPSGADASTIIPKRNG